MDPIFDTPIMYTAPKKAGKLRVVEIFPSIEGEGLRAGMPAVFIRLFGCNLNCSYCDTPYGKDPEYADKVRLMTVSEIVRSVSGFCIPNVTITGGEPMIHNGVIELINALLDRDYWVNVETNGTVTRKAGPDRNGLFYTVDFKTKSSGMTDKMDPKVFADMECGDVLKFVVGDQEDLEQTLEVMKWLTHDVHIYYSPVFGKIDPAVIVEFLLKHRLHQCHVQLQMHKYIWDPEKRGV